jgi:hypothetical protein
MVAFFSFLGRIEHCEHPWELAGEEGIEPSQTRFWRPPLFQ